MSKRKRKTYEYLGKSQTLSEWSRELGISLSLLHSRITYHGMSFSVAATKPTKSAVPRERDGKKTPEYMAWVNMRQRCNDPNFTRYENWGGRGIRVCDEWESFEAFLAHVGPKPEPHRKYSIDRIDNDKNYEPGNVRWSHITEQARNKRSTYFVTIDDEQIDATTLSEMCGILRATLKARLRVGWTVMAAVSLPNSAYTRACVNRGTINPYTDGHLTRVAAGATRHPKTRNGPKPMRDQ